MAHLHLITPDMDIDAVIDLYPATIPIFIRYGMQCVGCHVARFETIAGGAEIYGVDLDSLLAHLNAALDESERDAYHT